MTSSPYIAVHHAVGAAGAAGAAGAVGAAGLLLDVKTVTTNAFGTALLGLRSADLLLPRLPAH